MDGRGRHGHGAVQIPEMGEAIPAGGKLALVARSLVVLQRTGGE